MTNEFLDGNDFSESQVIAILAYAEYIEQCEALRLDEEESKTQAKISGLRATSDLMGMLVESTTAARPTNMVTEEGIQIYEPIFDKREVGVIKERFFESLQTIYGKKKDNILYQFN